MTPRERDELLEAASTPFRESDPRGRLVPAPEWWDLGVEDREELFARQLVTRELERAHDPLGWSGTVRAVMQKIIG